MLNRELAVFCKELSMFLKAGIPLHDGLELMVEDMKGEHLETTLRQLQELVKANKPLDEALEKVGGVQSYIIHMIQIGRETGSLDETLEALGRHYEREESLSQSIKSAVLYPVTLSIMMLSVMVILAVKVLPVFEQVFRSLGSELSGFAKVAMTIGSSIGRYAFVMILLILVVGIGFIIGVRNKHKINRGYSLFMKTALSQKVGTARLASALAMMLKSGMTIQEALKTALGVTDNIYLKQRVEKCICLLDAGHSVASTFEQVPIFSKVATRMIHIGLKTGCVDEVVADIANRYEEEVQDTLSKLIGVIEPATVALLALTIGAILLSVMIPLMGIMSTIG